MTRDEQLEKIMGFYERAGAISVWRNKEVYDSDLVSIWIKGSILYFVFEEDEIEDFKINITDIEDIRFDESSSITISIIELKNGEAVLIQNI